MSSEPSASPSEKAERAARSAIRPRTGLGKDFTQLPSASEARGRANRPWVSIEEAKARHEQEKKLAAQEAIVPRQARSSVQKILPDEKKRRAFVAQTELQIDEGHRGFGHQRREQTGLDEVHLKRNWQDISNERSLTPADDSGAVSAGLTSPPVKIVDQSFWSMAWPTSWMFDAQHQWRVGRTLVGLIIMMLLGTLVWAWRTGGLRAIFSS